MGSSAQPDYKKAYDEARARAMLRGAGSRVMRMVGPRAMTRAIQR
jgi:hypothetical protein